MSNCNCGTAFFLRYLLPLAGRKVRVGLKSSWVLGCLFGVPSRGRNGKGIVFLVLLSLSCMQDSANAQIGYA